MSGTCDKCGSTSGRQHGHCATKLSEIEWDGGSTCFGFSGISTVDLILQLSQQLCNLQGEWNAFTVSSDDVDVNGTDLTTVLTTITDNIQDLQQQN